MGCICWVGAFIGGMLFGFPGAIIGYILCYFLSRMVGEDNYVQNTTTNNTYYQERTQQQSNRFFNSLMVLSAYVIMADGKIMHSEMEFVRAFLRTNFGQQGAVSGEAILREHFNFKKTYGSSRWEEKVRNTCYEISATMPVEHRIQLISYLAEIAKADGIIENSEVDAIHFIAANLGLEPSIADQFLAISNTDTSLDNAYKILGVSPNATDDEVRKAYKRLVLRYHPDKVAHLGEDVKANATRKLQEINKARDIVYKSRGMN